jgi:nuclear pore complex protein Nup133
MYMNEVGEGHHEDIMRAFFRQKAGSIGGLLPVILTTVEGSSSKTRSSLAALSEANSTVLVSRECLSSDCQL